MKYAIIGGGPSLLLSDIEYLRGKCRVIVINDSYKIAPWADILYYCDGKWYSKNYLGVSEFSGCVATISDSPAHWNFCEGDTAGLSHKLNTLNTGRNSAYQALNLCKHLGATEIYLLGVDMGVVDGRCHWHDSTTTDPNAYDLMLPYWETALQDLGATKVYNCSMVSRIECFEKTKLKDVL